MGKFKIFLKIALFVITSSSCTIIQRTAVNTTADIAFNGHKEIQKMGSWEEIKSALPASLAFAETMYPSSPNNLVLITQLIKGYGALGFVIFETESLVNHQNKELKAQYLEQASISYSKSLNYGQKYLKLAGIEWNEIYKAISQEDYLFKLFDKKLSEKDYDALFFIGQSWASLINLNRDNVKLVNHLPIARSLIQYVCQKKPNFEEGICDLFEAIYLTSRPKTLGGNPEAGNKLFKKLIDNYPYNLLYPVSYAQYFLVPQKDFAALKILNVDLEKKFQKFKDSLIYPKYINEKNDFLKYEYNNLYNVIATLRMVALTSYYK